MLTLYIFAIIISAVGALGEKSPPICWLNKIDMANDRLWSDQSETCKSDNIGDGCCVTYVAGGVSFCPPFNDHDRQDLKEVVAQQVTKNGQFETSQVGNFKASFSLLTTAVKNHDVIKAWDQGIDTFDPNKDKLVPTRIFFRLDGNEILVQHDCCDKI